MTVNALSFYLRPLKQSSEVDGRSGRTLAERKLTYLQNIPTASFQRIDMNQKITLKDTNLLSRFPVGKWFAAGAYSIHGAKVARLYRLGLLDRRPLLIQNLPALGITTARDD
jgi:hypothetical protein